MTSYQATIIRSDYEDIDLDIIHSYFYSFSLANFTSIQGNDKIAIFDIYSESITHKNKKSKQYKK